MRTDRTLAFLTAIKDHNYKEWMHENKSSYQDARADFIQVVNFLLGQIQQIDPVIGALDAKECVFRINRDVRFSKDKSPYTQHMSASITMGGRHSRNAGYYLRLEPGGNSMIAGGTYLPAARELARIRQEIDYNTKEFKAIISDPEFLDFYGEIEGERIKTAPKGYSKDHKEIGYLQLKSFLFSHTFTDAQVLDSTFFEEIVRGCELLEPFISFLNQAIAE